MTDRVRELERASIRDFVESCSDLLATGRVLDYGCGLSPHRDLIAGDYVGYDDPDLPAYAGAGEDWPNPHGHGPYDVILCNQVIQYVPDTAALLNRFHTLLGHADGYLILTGPTCWPEVESTDLVRYTRAGIGRLLVHAGFTVVRLEHRAHVEAHGVRFALGWGAVARA